MESEKIITPEIDNRSDKLWIDDPAVLIDIDKYLEFFPRNYQTFNEKLNAFVRLAIYISVTLSFYKSNPKYMVILLIALFITFFVNIYSTKKDKMETIDEKYTLPTKDNPFMNVLMGDDPKRQPAINYTADATKQSLNIQKDIDESFNSSIYQDLNDVYCKNHSQREFYTMPSTTIPNDRESFQNWLYKEELGTCKQNPGNCGIYEDLKRNKPVSFNPYDNPIGN
jgi:hypothetical protein